MSLEHHRARLAQMGTEAQQFLGELTVFHGSFDWQAVVGLLLRGEKDHPLRDGLVQEGWLHALPDNRFVLSDEAKNVFAPSQSLRERHFEYYKQLHGNHVYTLFKKSRDPLIAEDWLNITAALDWGTVHVPHTMIEFVENLSPYILRHIPPDARRVHWQQAVDAAKCVHRMYKPGKAFETVADLARKDDMDEIVYFSYTRAMKEYAALGQNNDRNLLWKLKAYAYERGHFSKALNYLQLIEPLTLVWDMAPLLRDFGEVYGQLGELLTARDYFARALVSSETADDASVRTLWAWGRMESQFGDANAGCGFYRLALSIIEGQVSRYESRGWKQSDKFQMEKWQELLTSYAREFATITCEDDL